jgi:hypothetical protein
MKDCNCNKKPYTITHVSELDIDDLATIPDYFLGIRAVESETDGNTIYTPVRVPGARVMPTGNLANVTALAANNTALEIPENQVLAGYYDAQPGGNVMKVADGIHRAMFLMIGNYTNGNVLVQTTGFLHFPNGHQYIPLVQYYVGENGMPVTDETVTGQKLFMALDETTLNINGDF